MSNRFYDTSDTYFLKLYGFHYLFTIILYRVFLAGITIPITAHIDVFNLRSHGTHPAFLFFLFILFM